MRDRYASLREGLVGAWIPSVSGSGLLLPDLSGYGNNGTLTNMGPEDWVSSQYGRALEFDGSNDYVDLNGNLNKIGISSVFSITGWLYMKPSASDNNWTVVADWSSSVGLFFRADATRRVQAAIYPGNYRATGTTVIALEEWNFLAVVCNASSIAVFLNDKQEGSASVSGGIGSSGASTRIGMRGDGVNQTTGQLDDIRIYNRVLSDSEIKLLASRPGIGLRPQRRTMYYAPPTGARRRRILTSMP